MMINSSLFIIVLLVCQFSFSQNTHLATYKIKYLFREETMDPEAYTRLKALTTNEDDVELKLIFTNNKAISVVNDEYINGSNRMAFVLCLCSESKFYNVKDNVVKYNNKAQRFLGIEDNKYLITDALNDEKWVLEEESKQINGFKVYKATKVYTTVDGKNEPIVAWYAPELPYPYGPNGYSGLPGLIFQVQQGVQMFTLDKVLFDQAIEIPEEPANGIIISKQEYSQIMYDKTEGL